MQPHALLAASLLALAAGPLLHAALRRTPGGRRILQWAVLGAVAFLVLGHVLPECLEACGAIALVVAAVGFALPAAAERVVEARWARSSVWLGVAVLGLAAHALTATSTRRENIFATDASTRDLAIILVAFNI